MNPTQRIQDPFHNPFHNRFHVPVHSRLDEMQAYTHMIWLNEPVTTSESTDHRESSRDLFRAIAGAFGLLLLVIFSAAFLAN
jgi:hypothetical protein